MNFETFKRRVANKFLNESILCDFDWNFTINFHKKFDYVTRVMCEIYQKKRFDPNVQICKSVATCQNCRKNFFANDVRLYFSANFMNSKIVFFHLSNLFIAKKLFIAQIHVLMNYSRVKSVQYKYSDHIINFMQNTFKIVRRLSSLSQKLQIFHLKFFSFDLKNNVVQREYDRRFNVKRQNVQMWLEYLINNHSNYQHMSIDFNRLNLLLENVFIMKKIPFVTTNSSKINISSFQNSSTLFLLFV